MKERKLAVITGAASGIGLALAKACLHEKMNVVMADIDECALQEQIRQLDLCGNEVMGVVCDVSKKEDVNHLAEKTFARFKRVDLLINNAGVSGYPAPVWELDPEHVRHVMDVNLYGVLHGIQAFVPFLLEQTHPSHIVNMASFYGLCSGSQMAPYAMSKHAIVALSESLYFDFRRLNKSIDVSVVCPSFTNTQLMIHSTPKQPAGLHRILTEVMARGRSADEVAECIMHEIKNKIFYILPDKEIKNDCEQRVKAVIEQTMPHEHSLEKILVALSKGRSRSFC